MQNKIFTAPSVVLMVVLASMAIFMQGLVDAAPPFTVSMESNGGQSSYL